MPSLGGAMEPKATTYDARATSFDGFGRYWRHARRAGMAGLDILLDWQERAAQRRRLEAMSHRMLRDIGLSRADVARECAKPFWRI